MKLFDLSNEEVVATEAYVPNEDMVEEIANLQNEIVMSCEAMSEGVATVERLETMLASHENLPEAVKSDVAYCNVATENISMVCANIGLAPMVQVSVESIDDKELGSLSTEDIKATIQKVINAVKKMFLKVIAKIKQFITKLVHNGKRLDAKLDALKKIVNDPNAEDISKDASIEHKVLDKSLKFSTFILAELNVTDKIDLNVDFFTKLMHYSTEYKSENYISMFSLPKNLLNASGEEAKKIFSEYVKDSSSLFKSVSMLIKFFNDKLNDDPSLKDTYVKTESEYKNCVPIRLDNGKISGTISYFNTENAESYIGYKSYNVNTKDVIDMFDKVDIELPNIDSVKGFLNSIKKPSGALSEISKKGDAEIKSSKDLLNKLEDTLKDTEDSDSDKDKKFQNSVIAQSITEAYSVIPKVVNANIINYYNNINNILDLISTYIVVKK